MKKYQARIESEEINSCLRRLNNDENFKIDFREFCENMSPIIPGYTRDACNMAMEDLKIPTDPFSDDILVKSKFKALLKHDGIAFRLEKKKQILRDIETLKKRRV